MASWILGLCAGCCLVSWLVLWMASGATADETVQTRDVGTGLCYYRTGSRGESFLGCVPKLHGLRLRCAETGHAGVGAVQCIVWEVE